MKRQVTTSMIKRLTKFDKDDELEVLVDCSCIVSYPKEQKESEK